jgi:TP901 family phage tail tape measure protein
MTSTFAGGIAKLGAGVAAIGAPVGLIAGMAKVVSVGAEFQKQMSGVSAFVEGAGENMGALTDTAEELGRATTFTAAEAAEAMINLGKAGFSAHQVMASVPAVLTLAQAGNLSLADAATIATSAVKQFGLSATDTVDVVDALTRAASSGNLDVSNFATQMGFASGSAQALGMDVGETAATLAFLADGVTAEKMGRSFDAMASSMTTRTPAMIAAMDKLNLSFTDKESGQFKSLPQIVDEFNAAFAGMNPEEKESQLGAMFNTQAIRGFRFAMNRGGEALQDVLDKVADRKGFGLGQANKMIDNVAGSFEMLKSAVSGLMIDAFQLIQGPFQTSLTRMADFLSGPASKAFGEWLVPGIQMMATAFAPIARMFAGFVAVRVAVGLVAGAFGVLKGAAMFALSPILGISKHLTAAMMAFRPVIALLASSLISLTKAALLPIGAVARQVGSVAATAFVRMATAVAQMAAGWLSAGSVMASAQISVLAGRAGQAFARMAASVNVARAAVSAFAARGLAIASVNPLVMAVMQRFWSVTTAIRGAGAAALGFGAAAKASIVTTAVAAYASGMASVTAAIRGAGAAALGFGAAAKASVVTTVVAAYASGMASVTAAIRGAGAAALALRSKMLSIAATSPVLSALATGVMAVSSAVRFVGMAFASAGATAARALLITPMLSATSAAVAFLTKTVTATRLAFLGFAAAARAATVSSVVGQMAGAFMTVTGSIGRASMAAFAFVGRMLTMAIITPLASVASVSMGFLTTAITTAWLAMGAFGKATKTAFTQIVLVGAIALGPIAAIGLAMGGAALMSEKGVAGMKAGWASLSANWGNIFTQFSKAMTAAFNAFVSIAQGAMAMVGIEFDSGGDMMGGFVESMGGIGESIVRGLMHVEFFFANLSSYWDLALLKADLFGRSVVTNLSGSFTAVINWLSSNWSSIWADMGAVVFGVLDNIGQNVRNVFSAVWETVTSLGKTPLTFDMVPLTEGIMTVTTALELPPALATEMESQLTSQIAGMQANMAAASAGFMQEQIMASAFAHDATAESAAQTAALEEEAKNKVIPDAANGTDSGSVDTASTTERNPLGIALRGGKEMFDSINAAVRGGKDADLKSIAKQSTKQTALAEKQTGLLETIAENSDSDDEEFNI